MRPWIALVAPFALACAGSPPPKPGGDVARPAPPPATSVASAEAPPPIPPAPPDAPVAPPSEEPSAPKDPDDPWLAHRQIAPDVVVKTMKPAAAKVNQCFKEGLKRDPTIEGEVRIKFVIRHEGNVVDFKDDNSEMPDHEVVNCIGGVMKGLKFPVPASPGGAFGVYSTHLAK